MSLMKRSDNLFPSFLSGFGTDLFDDMLPWLSNRSMPAVNIADSDNEYRVEVAAPGLSKEDFKIEMNGNVLTVHSEKEMKNEENNDKYSRKEFSYSSFQRSFTLPEGTDAEGVNAAYKDGILTIHIPKKEEVRKKESKQIAIS